MAKALIVTGLAFGDEGKGAIVDHLCREHDADTVIRFNGGAQAAHNVVLPDGRHHTFNQFGSGTFAGARTHLSEHHMLNPAAIFQENARLIECGVPDALQRLSVHKNALVTTSFHVAANRLRELARGSKRHGSCGLGIGETMGDHVNGEHHVIFARDLLKPKTLHTKLQMLRAAKHKAILYGTEISGLNEDYRTLNPRYAPHEIDHLMELYKIFTECVEIRDDNPLDGTVVFEGAQGTLLDQDLPSQFQPYTTWSKCTANNAREILNSRPAKHIGVMRTYMTRHGAGPLPTEDTVAVEELHNGHNDWQQHFRLGWLDLHLLKFATHYSGDVDELAVTHVDTLDLNDRWHTRAADQLSHEAQTWAVPRWVLRGAPSAEILPLIEETLSLPVTITSHGPTHEDKREGVIA